MVLLNWSVQIINEGKEGGVFVKVENGVPIAPPQSRNRQGNTNPDHIFVSYFHFQGFSTDLY